MSHSELKWLLVDLNSYFASCEQQFNPALRGRPVGVVPMMAENTSCLAASVEAKRFGVKTGTLVKDARKLCPEIIFVEADHSRYVGIHEAIVEVVESCVPVHEVLSIDEMICKLTGSQCKEENAVALALKIKKNIEERVGICLKSSIGISVNKYLAKVGSDMQKPDGLTIIHKSDLPHKLFPLKLRDLPGIGYRMNERLQTRGVFSVENLCKASRAEMKSLWGGIWGERMYEWLRGGEPFVPSSKQKSMSHEHVLAPDFRTIDLAYAVLQKLLVKVAVRLRREKFYTRRLGVNVKFIGSNPNQKNDNRNMGNYGSSTGWGVSTSEYFDCSYKLEETQDTLTLLHAFQKIWKDIPLNKGKPLKVGITLSDFIPEAEHQFSLFGNPQKEILGGVLDSINERFGKNSVNFAGVQGLENTANTKISFSRVPKKDEF